MMKTRPVTMKIFVESSDQMMTGLGRNGVKFDKTRYVKTPDTRPKTAKMTDEYPTSVPKPKLGTSSKLDRIRKTRE